MTLRPGICVLPFVNMSGDEEQEYFSDGITEDIITDLSKVLAWPVVSRNSAFVFKGKSVDIPEVARRLDVSHVLEGSVRKSGGRVRVTAQLIDGATGGHVWAERYDRDLKDIFAIQDELSRAIAAALKLRLAGSQESGPERRGTQNPDAYNLYLMARKILLSSTMSSQRRYSSIVRLARRAADIDPDYARAWALVAIAQGMLRASFGLGTDNGLAAAERALALDPSLAEAHAARARAFISAGEFDAALPDAEEALRLDPSTYEVNYIAAQAYFSHRRFDRSRTHWLKAAEESEQDYLTVGMCMTCSLVLGDKDACAVYARAALSRAEATVAREPDNGTALGAMVGALATLGESERARALAARALLIDPDNFIMRYNIARAFATGLADRDGALELLQPVFDKIGSGGLSWVAIEPDFDGLRDDPRFRTMVDAARERLGAH